MKMPVIDVNRYSQVFTTIETHTAGEPTRIIVSGMCRRFSISRI